MEPEQVLQNLSAILAKTAAQLALAPIGAENMCALNVAIWSEALGKCNFQIIFFLMKL